jgi:hypothetical protein
MVQMELAQGLYPRSLLVDLFQSELSVDQQLIHPRLLIGVFVMQPIVFSQLLKHLQHLCQEKCLGSTP